MNKRLMKEIGSNNAVTVLEPIKTNGNGHRGMTATADLPIAKYVTNDQWIGVEKSVFEKLFEIGLDKQPVDLFRRDTLTLLAL